MPKFIPEVDPDKEALRSAFQSMVNDLKAIRDNSTNPELVTLATAQLRTLRVLRKLI